MTDWGLTLLTSSVAAAAVTYALNYGFNRRNLHAKLSDRVYELNKLMLSHPAAFASFWAEANRKTDDYFANRSRQNSPASDDILRHQAIAYYYINMFEEMYFAHRLPTGNQQESAGWEAWKRYMFTRLKHPLIRETLLTATGIQVVGDKLELSTNGHYAEHFVRFLYDNRHEWQTGWMERVSP